jgi:hypothetical protein
MQANADDEGSGLYQVFLSLWALCRTSVFAVFPPFGSLKCSLCGLAVRVAMTGFFGARVCQRAGGVFTCERFLKTPTPLLCTHPIVSRVVNLLDNFRSPRLRR